MKKNNFRIDQVASCEVCHPWRTIVSLWPFTRGYQLEVVSRWFESNDWSLHDRNIIFNSRPIVYTREWFVSWTRRNCRIEYERTRNWMRSFPLNHSWRCQFYDFFGSFCWIPKKNKLIRGRWCELGRPPTTGTKAHCNSQKCSQLWTCKKKKKCNLPQIWFVC